MLTLIQAEGKDKHRSFEMRKNLTQPYRTVNLFKYKKIFQIKIGNNDRLNMFNI